MFFVKTRAISIIINSHNLEEKIDHNLIIINQQDLENSIKETILVFGTKSREISIITSKEFSFISVKYDQIIKNLCNASFGKVTFLLIHGNSCSSKTTLACHIAKI